MPEENSEDKRVALLLEDLAALEDYVHDLFNFAPLPICFVSPMGILLEVNPSLEKVSKYDLEEIVGESVNKIFEEEKVKQVIEDVLEKGEAGGKELNFFPKDSEPMPVQVFARARKNEQGKTVGLFLGLFDLSEIKKSEQELKLAQSALFNILEDTETARRKAESERNRTQTIITNLADGLIVFDDNNKASLVNPQAEKLLDVRSEKIIGKTVSEISKIPSLGDLIKIVGQEIKTVSRREWALKSDLILQVSTVQLLSTEEKEGILLILHDITREKIVEGLKTEFVSIAAHQLRTPLSAIKWTLRMLLDGDLGQVTQQQRDFLEKTYKSNERMITLINSLLNVTRIEEGRFLYYPILSDIAEIIQSIVDSLREEAERRQVDIRLEKPKEGLSKVLVDNEKIKLAIQNLIDNAIKYTLNGGEVVVSLGRLADGEIMIKIRDTGVGIPENQQNRVFSKFFRGANVMRLDTEGTGLGLFITKNVIEAHGGKIWFESKEGKGTTFYFTLPARREFEVFLERF